MTTPQATTTPKPEEQETTIAQVSRETASTAVATQAKAEVEARYLMALKRPRDWDEVRVRLLHECGRTGFAESARYRKPIGKGVTGFSIRFAEAAARCMGNIYTKATVTYEGPQERIVKVSVMDLESNFTTDSDCHVSKTTERLKPAEGEDILRVRINSRGQSVYTVWATEDDMLNKTNAAASKALRNGILRILPGDLQDEAEAAIAQTMRSDIQRDPDAARKKVVDAFAALGVSPGELKAYLGHDIAASSPHEIEELRTIHRSIRDGETTWRATLEAKTAPPEKDEKKPGLADRIQTPQPEEKA